MSRKQLPIVIALASGLLLLLIMQPLWAVATEQSEQQQNATILLIFFVALALIVSFLCSVAETVLLSITPAYIASLAGDKPELATRLKQLRLDQVDRSLAAILTMNTIAHTVGAIEAGAQASVVFGSNWVGFFSAIMTLLILFFSEIIPKTLGALYWTRLLVPTVAYISSLIWLLYPLVRASEAVTKMVTGEKQPHTFSREEFLAMTGLGESIGEISNHESQIIQNILRFRDQKTRDIMTPRTVIEALPQQLSIAEAIQVTTNSPFSRFPVYLSDIDTVNGFVLKDDILLYESARPHNVTLQSLRRDIEVVPESMRLTILLEFMLAKRQHIALVVDEFGEIAGLVTMEDIIETLLGKDIIDESDNVTDMQLLARQKWLKRAKRLQISVDDGSQKH